jgi:hypothetical protein
MNAPHQVANDHRAWVATRKGLAELRRGSAGHWQLARMHFVGEPVSAVLPPTAAIGGRMLAALSLGHFGVKLHASDDGGTQWQEVGCPTYPAQPPDLQPPVRSDIPAFEGAPPATVVPWKLVLVWSLAAQGATLWAGTLPGGLFRSDDGGQHWQLDATLWNDPSRQEWFGGGYDVPGIHSICPHPNRADELLVAVSSGGVWHKAAVSQTQGSWQPRCRGMRAAYMPPALAEDPRVQDPHRVVRCSASPEVLWCQHHNGIWRSSDNAATWQELQAPRSNFGFAVACHPHDPLTAWFVPGIADERRIPVDGALVVNRSRDGGQSFETLSTGLPAADCYDLVYRHGLAVDASGENLLMGSTTGHLWHGSGGGARWQLDLPHLPPIAAVAFG